MSVEIVPLENSFEDLLDLASERVGGVAVICSDDFFAGMENLVKAVEPKWDENAYTDRGKWMDGWESRRSHRENDAGEHEDFCVVRLGAPGVVCGVVVDTAFFRGNFPSHCALEGAAIDGHPSGEDLAKHAAWTSILPKSALHGNSKNRFVVDGLSTRFTHVRLRIFPDGGVARLRVYGEPLPDWRLHGGLHESHDLASAVLGGLVIACSDMFFGSRHNLLFPGLPGGMHDGWETRRSRRAGYDWAVVRLAATGVPTRAIVDTSHFKGNCPESFALDGTAHYAGDKTDWQEVAPRRILHPHTAHTFLDIAALPCSHVRLRIYPDGGVARFRLFGKITQEEKERQQRRFLQALPRAQAEHAFLSCCGCKTWAQQMCALLSEHELSVAADRAFAKLQEEDWLEAFRAHPRIGEKKSTPHATTTSAALSQNEQRQVDGAADATKAKLAQRNQEYFQKFGFIFIVKATGKSAEEMLGLLEQRLENDRSTEIKIAGDEQRKITALRLERMAG